ncbi:MAG TPA: hypothetical protein VMH39_09195 [Gemmatimonadaceae bacterium]|nr:hypothetical protein [Gemmatimonadaceae bacterium]
MRRHRFCRTRSSAAVAGLGLGLGLVLATGCAESTFAPIQPDVARDTLANFQTDSLAYTFIAGNLGYAGTIHVQFTNRSGDTVLFANCQGSAPLELDKLTAGQWQSVWSPVTASCASAPIAVAPGQAYQTAILVFGGYPGANVVPQFATADLPGTYRMVWDDVVNTQGNPLRLGHRVSNEFAVAVEPRPGG